MSSLRFNAIENIAHNAKTYPVKASQKIADIFKNDIFGKNNFNSTDFSKITNDNTDPADGQYKTIQMWYKCGSKNKINNLGEKNKLFNDIDISTFKGMTEQCKKKCSEINECNGFTRQSNINDNDIADCYLKKIPIINNGGEISYISNETDKPFNSWIGTTNYPINIIDETNNLKLIY